MAPEHSPSVLVLAPFDGGFDAMFRLVASASERVGARAHRLDQMTAGGLALLPAGVRSADVIVCDITGQNPNVLYELGAARSLGKPIILITQQLEHLPFDIRASRVLRYSLEPPEATRFTRHLAESLHEALTSPAQYVALQSAGSTNTVFISYSHRDAFYLERLLVHLRPLERAGRLTLFVDTKLRAGDKWKSEIKQALANARVAILLVSADFLASDFIVQNELPPLLQQAESLGTRIIPVIVKPCRFARDPHLREFQALNDPAAALINLSEGRQEEILDHVAKLVEDLLPSAVPSAP